MDRDLFLSILALDAYNQGYSAGTNREGDDVGSATFLKEEIGQSAQNIGFYGIAYDWNGETIISYRGTDNYGLQGDFSPNGSGASDIITGWSIALGFSAGTQVDFATSFYNDVLLQISNREHLNITPNITLTGHSGRNSGCALTNGNRTIIF